jgi:hypothetical protein
MENNAAVQAHPRAGEFIVIALAAGIVLGLILSARRDSASQTTTPAPILSVNDLSRWATIYSLVERGTYNIDETPWPTTIDRVRVSGHFYSSKPPLLPTVLAAEYWVLKMASFGRLSFATHPEAVIRILVVSTNLVPFVLFLLLFSRLLDELAPDPWRRLYCTCAAALGTSLTSFCVTLNNHTVAAFSALFALFPLYRILCNSRTDGRYYAAAGFFAAFTAVNELPAAAFLALAGAALLWKTPRPALKIFLPFALLPLAAHFTTNYLAVGTLAPAYADKQAYDFPGSYWKVDATTGRLTSTRTDPVTGKTEIRRNIDSLYEPWPVYLFHMLVGHHGIFSLTPLFLLCFAGLIRKARDRAGPLREFALGSLLLTLVLLVFYVFFAGQRNYGGATSGLRWLFWLIPFWLLFLPEGLRRADSRAFRGVALGMLLLSAMSVFYSARNPWTRPWIHQLLSTMGWIWY